LLKAIEVGATDAPTRNMAERYDSLISIISRNTSRLREALTLSEHVLNHYPTYDPIFSTRCSILLKLNWTDQFIQACEQGVIRNKHLPEAHYNLGIAYTKLGHMSHAVTFFTNMLELDRDSTVARYHLASVLQTSGEAQQLMEARLL
jgi:tetratricopeptide (TPR) repeat protein